MYPVAMRRSGKIGIAIIVALVLLCPLMIYTWHPESLLDPYLIKLPHTRDPRLFGTWHGPWRFMDEPQARGRTTIFREDGTGLSVEDGERYGPKFTWGTEDGVLFTKRVETDAWVGTNRGYSLSADGQALKFSKARMFDLVAKEMKRSRPAPSKP